MELSGEMGTCILVGVWVQALYESVITLHPDGLYVPVCVGYMPHSETQC